jgi:hypothetical protein
MSSCAFRYGSCRVCRIAAAARRGIRRRCVRCGAHGRHWFDSHLLPTSRHHSLIHILHHDVHQHRHRVMPLHCLTITTGTLYAHSEQLDGSTRQLQFSFSRNAVLFISCSAAALLALMDATQTLCEGGSDIRTYLLRCLRVSRHTSNGTRHMPIRLRVPGYLVDIFCVCEIDSVSSSSSSSSNNIATSCLKALRACIINHPSCKKVRRLLSALTLHRLAPIINPKPRTRNKNFFVTIAMSASARWWHSQSLPAAH